MTWTAVELAVVLAVLLMLPLLVVLRAARRREQELLRDPVTGLPNRRAFERALEQARQAAAADPERNLVVAVFALKELKELADEFGQEFADAVLVDVYDRFRQTVPSAVTRLDGDELIGCAATLAPLEVVMDELSARLAMLSRPVEIDGRTVVVHGCAGIAVASPDDGALETLRNAGLALRRARRLEHAAVCRYEPEMLDELKRRMATERDFETALAGDQFEVHYQPIVRAGDGCPTRVEALVRWRHPDRGLLAPDEFVRIAEANGFIVPLGAYVLGEACRQVQEWRRRVPELAELGVSVNVSPRQLVGNEFAAHVRGVLADTGLAPAHLTLEITESVATSDAVVGQLRELRALGVRIAIDDFGTGYSSLSTLVDAPFDVLKIDRAFVDEIDRSSKKVLLTSTILRLGRQLGLVTTAEGVERLEQLELLRTLGCVEVQGYLVARPASAAATLPVLVRRTSEARDSKVTAIADIAAPAARAAFTAATVPHERATVDAEGLITVSLGPAPSTYALSWVAYVRDLIDEVTDDAEVSRRDLETVRRFVDRWERAALEAEEFCWRGREDPDILWTLLRAAKHINDAYVRRAATARPLTPSPEAVAFREQLIEEILHALGGEVGEPGSIERVAHVQSAWPEIGPMHAA